MKKCFLLPATALLALAAASRPAIGEISPNRFTTFSFAMPSVTDPNFLTFRVEGAPALFDDAGVPITGSTFLQSNPNQGFGLEVHGNLPRPTQSPNPVLEIDLVTDYLGTLVLSSTSDDPNYVPWLFEDNGVGGDGLRRFRYFAQTGSAPLEDDFLGQTFFGLFQATTTDSDFADSRIAAVPFSFTNRPGGGPIFTGNPFAVPEPGTVALFGSLIGSGGLLLRAKRRSKAA